ncbi:MAG: UDP-N-acetylmuramate dehydrogenase [Myxococcales bacterium]|nr:MAG: UDP-N-acetylmuramate dehydrogenase [Myxococcales bacterium]
MNQRVKPPEGVQCKVSLAQRTTLQVGGAAEFYADVKNETQLRSLLSWSAEQKLPVHLLGDGSNIVVADEGVPGLVLHMALQGRKVERKGSQVLIDVAAGVSWDYLVAYSVTQGWAGMECLSGIPGTVGATPIQNVGAYGQEVSELITKVKVFDVSTQKSFDLLAKDCDFSYRNSLFKKNDTGLIVLAVEFKLEDNGPAEIRYAELKEALTEPKAVTLRQVRQTVLELRANKGMYIDADDYVPSAGSFFMNPVLDEKSFAAFEKRCQSKAPSFEMNASHRKIPAAWLIEAAGFKKGQSFGPVRISERHALSLVNLSGATSRDLLLAATEIQDKVEKIFGVRLQLEPCVWP